MKRVILAMCLLSSTGFAKHDLSAKYETCAAEMKAEYHTDVAATVMASPILAATGVGLIGIALAAGSAHSRGLYARALEAATMEYTNHSTSRSRKIMKKLYDRSLYNAGVGVGATVVFELAENEKKDIISVLHLLNTQPSLRKFCVENGPAFMSGELKETPWFLFSYVDLKNFQRAIELQIPRT